MSNREKYMPGPAAGARVEKDGEKWTLVLVRDLKHPPAKVWTALTDPEHLREWAPFDSDRSLGAVGTAKLTTVGAPTPQVSEARVKRADAPRSLEYHLGRGRPALGAGSPGQRKHPAHALAQHSQGIHIDGRRGLAYLLRRAGRPSRRPAHRTHGRRRSHEVRGMAAVEWRVRQAIRRRAARLAFSPAGLKITGHNDTSSRSRIVNIFLLVLQVLLALHTAMGAVWKFSNSEQAVPSLKAIPHGVWLGMSGFELLCSLCLILPVFHKPLAILVPVAALGIAAEMLFITVVHLLSGDGNHGQMIYWLVVAAICAFIAYGRFVLKPL